MSPKDLEVVLDKIEVIIVDAWAPWCQPCKTIGVKFEALGDRFESFIQQKRLLLLKDNIDNEEASYHRSLVDVVPTFFIYVGGKVVDVLTGVDFDRLEDFLENYFQAPAPAHPTAHPAEQARSMPQIKQSRATYVPKNM
jgi:thioredoxin-like negative regulator of GroEL